MKKIEEYLSEDVYFQQGTNLNTLVVSEDTNKQTEDCVSSTQETLELEENRRIPKRRRLLSTSVSEDTNKQIEDCVSNTQETVELCPQPIPQTLLKRSPLEEAQELKKFKRNEREPVYFGDYKLANLKTSEAKKLWHIARNQISKYRTTIKTLRVKQHRLIKKVKSLDDLVDQLKKSV
ncbi:hypothetical protein Zmor_003919 [Zophobas morio]|uniref:Uncharacterized protein n=1 Tax=Zophobas morio TaxID=2755281 RepID=A0AA38HQC2_9CUCU|nr:hypothetical protein Zmor_003919 [Zophobas morio]